jgi:predicted NAD-dependent protein-ADP-ribosyltransferase YbiA (DUF1768 family)
MVKSLINEKIEYSEKNDLYDEDVGYESPQYLIEIFNIPVYIVLGKQKYHNIDKNVIYFPIYLIDKNDIIIKQIGIFETKKNDVLKFIDEEGDVDINNFSDPLLYSSIDKKFIDSIYNNNNNNNNNNNFVTNHNLPLLEIKKDVSIDNPNEKEDLYIEIEDDPTIIKIKEDQLYKVKKDLNKKLGGGLFEITDQDINIPLLKTETHKDAENLKKEYKKSRNNNWLEDYMHNNNYNIIDNEGSGDCLFSVIRDSFSSIGYKTSVSKIRALLADNFSRELYNKYKDLYDSFETQIVMIKEELENIKTKNKHYVNIAKKLSEKTDTESRIELKKLINEAKVMKNKKKELEEELKDTRDVQYNSVGLFRDLDTYDKYIDYMQTQDYRGDNWSILTLEVRTNPQFKIIIMDENMYKQGDKYNVIQCGELSPIIITHTNKIIGSPTELLSNDSSPINKVLYRPIYYIIASYSNKNYKLVSYKNKKIFRFDEIPYSIKCLVVNKCLEKNAGSFNEIQEFINFREALGISVNNNSSDSDNSDDEDEYENNTNAKTTFIFHSLAPSKIYPGKSTHEKISNEDKIKYIKLNKMNEWRRKLDDSYVIDNNIGYIKIDGINWKSIDHYMNSVRFKKQNKDFYEKLGNYTPNEVKEITDLNKVDKTGIRPKNINEDPDFKLGQNEKYRKNALISKFSQNEDLKQLLISTQDAVLKKYIQRKPPVTDKLLMDVRREIQLANK